MKNRFVVIGYTGEEITHVKWISAENSVDACIKFNKFCPKIIKIKVKHLD